MPIHFSARAVALGALLTCSRFQAALAVPEDPYEPYNYREGLTPKERAEFAYEDDDGEIYLLTYNPEPATSLAAVLVPTTGPASRPNKAVVKSHSKQVKKSTVNKASHKKTVKKVQKHKTKKPIKKPVKKPTKKVTKKPVKKPTKKPAPQKVPVKKTTTKKSTTTTIRTSTTTVHQSLTSLKPSDVQSATSGTVQTSGSIHSSLETTGEPKSQPFATNTVSPTTKVSVINTASTSLPSPTISNTMTGLSSQNVFVAIQTDAPPPQINRRTDHPVPRLGIQPQTAKLETNSFYANFFLGSRASTSFTHPYSLGWSQGGGGIKSWGISISHIERSQLAYGLGTPNQYFINPIGIQSIIMSANELGANTNMTMDSLTKFSANINLMASAGSPTLITMPLVQGMGLVTAIYNSSTPLLQSSVSFLKLTYVGRINSNQTYKYTVGLNDGTTWALYVSPSNTGYAGNTFTVLNANNIVGATGFSGTIQVAKIPSGSSDALSVYDKSAGVYATTASLSGSVSGKTGTYGLTWTKAGMTSQTLLMFALPHHMETLTTTAGVTDVMLQTTTKGLATALLADSWTLQEPNMPIDMTFAPWSPSTGPITSVSSSARQLINTAGSYELSEDIVAQTNLNSMYYSGKGLAKFAAIVYALHDIVGNKTLAYTGLQKLEAAFATFVNNTQVYPLFYESAWGGAVSSSTYVDTSNPYAFNDDFGNTYYNDHHFHYGYFVYAAAVIGYLDPPWLSQGSNKAWVNMLVRDYANPVTNDAYFPFSRSFDWYHGHSWAKGLFESADGKDQESSSEDSNAAYAIKMWGRTIGDHAMEGRGALMQSIQARSLQHYFLFNSNNTVEPAGFIGNKVSGILFENKMDHTTYFGNNIEYIQGIHMLPLLPFSTLTRAQPFVTQEWNQYFANGYAQNVTGGWRGVLMANLAIIQPVNSYKFFSQPNFDYSQLDGGASLTWYLTYSAALGGSPSTSSKRDVSGLWQDKVKRMADGFVQLFHKA